MRMPRSRTWNLYLLEHGIVDELADRAAADEMIVRLYQGYHATGLRHEQTGHMYEICN